MIEQLTQEINNFKEYAHEQFPNEACGLLLSTGKLLLVENTSDDPETNFRINRVLNIAVFKKLKVVFHSHIDFNKPSTVDIANQKAIGVPWIILYLDKDNSFVKQETIGC